MFNEINILSFKMLINKGMEEHTIDYIRFCLKFVKMSVNVSFSIMQG